MPTELQVQSRLRRTIPIPQSALPKDEKACPICFEPYAATPKPSGTPKSKPRTTTVMSAQTSNANIRIRGLNKEGSEVSVRVQSLWPGSQCRHAFGSNCIEAHFRSLGPWSNKCPTCREEWFPEEDVEENEGSTGNGGEGDEYEQQESESQRGSTQRSVRVAVPRRINAVAASSPETVTPVVSSGSSRPAASSTSSSTHSVSGDRSDVPEWARRQMGNMEGLTSRGKVMRSVEFLNAMLLTEEIDSRDQLTSLRVKHVEIAIENLWQRLQFLGLERDREYNEPEGRGGNLTGKD